MRFVCVPCICPQARIAFLLFCDRLRPFGAGVDLIKAYTYTYPMSCLAYLVCAALLLLLL
jgi:hypothetical protein